MFACAFVIPEQRYVVGDFIYCPFVKHTSSTPRRKHLPRRENRLQRCGSVFFTLRNSWDAGSKTPAYPLILMKGTRCAAAAQRVCECSVRCSARATLARRVPGRRVPGRRVPDGGCGGGLRRREHVIVFILFDLLDCFESFQ